MFLNSLPGGWPSSPLGRAFYISRSISVSFPIVPTLLNTKKLDDEAMDKVEKTEEEWRRELTPEQYRVLREKGTEPAFSGAYADTKDKGVYRCAACGASRKNRET